MSFPKNGIRPQSYSLPYSTSPISRHFQARTRHKILLNADNNGVWSSTQPKHVFIIIENQEVLAAGLDILLDRIWPHLEVHQCLQVHHSLDWPDGDLTGVSSSYLVMLAIWSWFWEVLHPLPSIEAQKIYDFYWFFVCDCECYHWAWRQHIIRAPNASDSNTLALMRQLQSPCQTFSDKRCRRCTIEQSSCSCHMTIWCHHHDLASHHKRATLTTRIWTGQVRVVTCKRVLYFSWHWLLRILASCLTHAVVLELCVY